MGQKPKEARARDRAATEAAILAGAEAIAARDGFAALTVAAIAAEAGVDRKLVYRYFGGADGVIEQLGARTERWLAGTQAPRAADQSYADEALAAFDAYAAALAKDDALQQMLAWELTERSPLTAKLDAARSKAMMAQFAGFKTKRPAEVDAPAVNAVALAALHYLMLRRRALGGFSGLKLDAKGWARAMAVLHRMLARELGA